MSVGSHRFAGQSAQQQAQALDRARAEALARRRHGWAIARGTRVEPPWVRVDLEWLREDVGRWSPRELPLVTCDRATVAALLDVVDAAREFERVERGPGEWARLVEALAPFVVAPAVDVDEPGAATVDEHGPAGAECRALSPDGVGPACSCSGSVCALGFERCEPPGRVFNERMQAEDRRRGRAALGIEPDGRSPLAVRLLVEAA